MATIQERTSGDGEVTYRVLVRLKGYRTKTATFERKTDARDWAQQIEAAMKERRYFKGAESKKHTLTELIDRHLTRLERENSRRHKEVKPMLDWWKAELGHCILADLTKSSIVEKVEKLASYKRQLKKGGEKPRSAARVNRFISALSPAFTLAVDQLEWLEHNPMQKVRLLKEPRGRVRSLDDDEMIRLLNACRASENPCLYLVVVSAISTGARLDEIMTLNWKDVDLTRETITLHETKNDERRVLPLKGHALELTKAHNKVRHLNSDLVFPSPSDTTKPYYIRTAWHTARKRAEMKDFRFHDLRHTAASRLAMSGASLLEIASVLGHKTLAMVKRYAHLTEPHTHSIVARMNEKVFTPTKEKEDVQSRPVYSEKTHGEELHGKTCD